MSSEYSYKSKNLFFSDSELVHVGLLPIPQHIAIIMDGNRRWSGKISDKVTDPLGGHWVGAEILPAVVEAAVELGIKTLTLYAFSTENWRRSPKELEVLLFIFEQFLKINKEKICNKSIRVDVIGNISSLPLSLQEEISSTKEMTKGGTAINVVVAINYGGRDELRRAITAIAKDVKEGRLSESSLTEELIGNYLDTAPFGDPDLLIRTSGERRISNFLLWQLAYTEIYTTEVLWPEFTPQDLLTAVLDFQKRSRRQGA